MINQTTSLQTYKFFNAFGDGLFSTAANAFVTSHEDRKLTAPLLALGLVSKSISMIPFYSEVEIQHSQPHPISGTSYPTMPGLISAYLSALAGNTPASKLISKTVSLIAGGSLNYFNRTMVYETPSTLLCSNAICEYTHYDDPYYCLSHNEKLKYNASAQDDSSAPCPQDVCLARDSYNIVPPITSPQILFSLIAAPQIIQLAFHSLRRLYRNPLQNRVQQANGLAKPLKERIKEVALNVLFLVPSLAHLTAIYKSDLNRNIFILYFEAPFVAAPYLVALSAFMFSRLSIQVVYLTAISLAQMAISLIHCAQIVHL